MDVKKEFNSIPKALIATLLYIIGIELLGLWVLIPELFGSENYHIIYILIQGSLQLIAVLIFIYFVKQKTLKQLILSTQLKWYFIAIVLGISFIFIQTPINELYNFLFDSNYLITYDFDGLSRLTNFNLLTIIILIPIAEEIFFRSYIQGNLLKENSALLTILFSAILFAFIHSPYSYLLFGIAEKDWHLFFITIFIGLISGLFYFKSKSIGPSILFHICGNLMATIV